MIKCRFDVMAIIVYTKLFIYLFYLMCFREEKRKVQASGFFRTKTLSHTETIRLAFKLQNGIKIYYSFSTDDSMKVCKCL